MRLTWSDLAIEDLQNIKSYIARDNPERADSFVLELIECAEELTEPFHSLTGTPAKWIFNPNVRELYYQNYTIVYELENEQIYIHEVHNMAKNPRQI